MMGRSNQGDGENGEIAFQHSDRHILTAVSPIEWHTIETGSKIGGIINIDVAADDSPVNVDIYEGIVITSPGTPLDTFDLDRVRNAAATVYMEENSDANINAGGAVLIEVNRIPLGAKTGGVTGGETLRHSLRPNTIYGIRIENATDPLKDTTIAVNIDHTEYK